MIAMAENSALSSARKAANSRAAASWRSPVGLSEMLRAAPGNGFGPKAISASVLATEAAFKRSGRDGA